MVAGILPLKTKFIEPRPGVQPPPGSDHTWIQVRVYHYHPRVNTPSKPCKCEVVLITRLGALVIKELDQCISDQESIQTACHFADSLHVVLGYDMIAPQQFRERVEVKTHWDEIKS